MKTYLEYIEDYLKDLKQDYPEATNECKVEIESDENKIYNFSIIHGGKEYIFTEYIDVIYFLKNYKKKLSYIKSLNYSFSLTKMVQCGTTIKKKDMTTCKLGDRHQVENGYIYFMENDDMVIDKFKLYSYKLFGEIIQEEIY